MSVVKITLTDPTMTVSLGAIGNGEMVNANDVERKILASLAAVAWQNAKTRKEYNAAQTIVDDLDALPADKQEIDLSSDDLDRLAEAYLSIAGQRPAGWRIAGRALLRQLLRSRD